jgi:hypothetical protein
MLLEASGAFLSGCRNDTPGSVGDGDSSTKPAETATAAPALDASEPLPDNDLEPRTPVEGRRDGGVDPACEGSQLSLLASAADPRCAISEREWNARARAGAAAPDGGLEALRQEAVRDGDRIVLSIVNGGAMPVVVPLRYHPGHPEMAFSVLAVPPKQGVFELAPAREPEVEAALAAKTSADGGAGRSQRWSDVAELDAGSLRHRVHSAQIRLLPGGRASARLDIDPRVVKRLDRKCPAAADAGARPTGAERDGGEPCMPQRLVAGSVILHVGQLLAGRDVGPPARVAWDAP